jgi:large subunit ribosomal protein L34
MALQTLARRCNSLTGKALFDVIVGFPKPRVAWFRHVGRLREPRHLLHIGSIMKRTYQASKVRRARTHGFLVRMKTRGGRAVINARRAKGRKRLAV